MMNKGYPVLIFIIVLLIGFSCDTPSQPLPEIHVLSKKQINSKEKTDCVFKYVNNEESFFIPGRVRQRGGSSISFPKWNLSINLAHKLPLGQLPNDDDFILSACYADKTFMRHKLAYDLFLQMNQNNVAPKSTYVVVYLKGDYQGLY
jgi:CotH kinase protein